MLNRRRGQGIGDVHQRESVGVADRAPLREGRLGQLIAAELTDVGRRRIVAEQVANGVVVFDYRHATKIHEARAARRARGSNTAAGGARSAPRPMREVADDPRATSAKEQGTEQRGARNSRSDRKSTR